MHLKLMLLSGKVQGLTVENIIEIDGKPFGTIKNVTIEDLMTRIELVELAVSALSHRMVELAEVVNQHASMMNDEPLPDPDPHSPDEGKQT